MSRKDTRSVGVATCCSTFKIYLTFSDWSERAEDCGCAVTVQFLNFSDSLSGDCGSNF